jgi:hypothetical protein
MVDAGYDGTGILLTQLAEAGARLGRERFQKNYGDAFLLLARVGGGPDGFSAEPVTAVERTGPRTMMAYPLKKRPDAPYDFVSVGRSPQNDVVLMESSVSRMHATLDKDGEQWRILDAGSRHGTKVNGELAPARGHGQPIVLTSGDRVKFGDVIVSFVGAAGVLDLTGA